MKTIKFSDFMSGDYKKESKLASHLKRNKKVYLTIVGSTALFIGLPDISLASTGIDEMAKGIYYDKLLVVGKWALILKGGWDTIHKSLQEDFEGAKKTFFSYLIVYMILWGLPWGLDQVESVFST